MHTHTHKHTHTHVHVHTCARTQAAAVAAPQQVSPPFELLLSDENGKTTFWSEDKTPMEMPHDDGAW
jgi:hypothetical protein